jgi:hypothetical protein
VAHTGPIHGIVDASPAWVARRLSALSATLLLPCPVRDAFLFPANEAFYALCTTSVISLQQAARRVVEHLGLECDTVVVTYRSDLPNPARIEREGGHWFIEIADKHRSDGPVLGAILAHECCHILLEERGVPRFDTAVDEVHVDLALMLAGLGALTLNAIEDRTISTPNQITTIHRSFGYLRAKLLRYAYAHVASALRIDRKRALAPLTRPASRDDVSAHLLTNVRARLSKLAYRPLASHVIVPCSSAACSKRLRVPTGTLGKARCPECAASRAFDGRPFSIQAQAKPAPMKAAPLPQDRALDRAGRFVHNLSEEARIMAVVVLVVMAAPAGFSLYRELSRAPLGGPCERDPDCHSGLCLHAARPSHLDSVLYPHHAAALLPNACSKACKTDAECPSTFECRDGVMRDAASLFGDGVEVRVCVRR